jgi:hypothetical protein
MFSTRRRKPLPQTRALAEYFERRTGERLTITSMSRRLEALGIPRADLLDGSGIERKYGVFTIVVIADPRAFDEDRDPEAPDHRGIVWSEEVPERGPNAGVPRAAATKRYGQGIKLNWFRDDNRLETDERWEQLDAVLTDFARG